MLIFCSMIRANCRVQLTADDFSFIVRALSLSPSSQTSLVELLCDENERDAILEHEALAAAILESPESIAISPRLLFYVLCRRVLKETRVNSRESSDYIASLLEKFLHSGRLYSPEEMTGHDMRYVSDMLKVLMRATPREAFVVRTHIANYALFLSGIFYEHIQKKTLRGGPDVSFYEMVGKSSFALAAQNREAKRFCLGSVYSELAEGFQEVRLALNQLADRFLHLEGSTGTPLVDVERH